MKKINIERFIIGVFSTSLGTILSTLLGFVNIYIAVRLVSKEQFGAFILLQVIVYSLVMLCDLGMNISTTKFIACAPVERKTEIINTILQVKGVMSLVFSTVFFLLGSYLLSLLNYEWLEEYVLVIILLFALESFNALFLAILQGLHLYKKLASSQVLLGVSNLGFMAVLLFAFGMGIYALIFARIISLVMTLCYQSRGVPIKIFKALEKETFKEIFRFAYPLGFNNILTFVFLKVDRLIIGTFLSSVGVAYYGAASKIPDAMRQMFEAFRTVYFPNLAELLTNDNKQDAEVLLNNAIRLVSLVTTLATLTVFVFQEEIVRVLFSEEYLQCAPVLSVLMLAVSIGLVGYLLGTSLVAAGHSKLPVIINTVDALVAVSANVYMVPRFGILGAACAGVMARSFTLPLNIYFLKKTGIKVYSMAYLKPLLIMVICLAISNLKIWGYNFDLFVIALYIFLCASFSVIKKSDITTFANGLRSENSTV